MALVHRRRAHPILLVVCFVVVVYAICSVAIAVSTSDRCNTISSGAKSWQLMPPHWECGA